MTPAADTLLGNDSLRRAVERLFVQGARFEPLAAADSVRQALPAATAADLYGPESYPVPGAPLPVPGATPAADTALQAFLLLLGVFYVLLLSNHLGNVYTLFMRATSGTATPHRTPDLRGGSNYVPFLNLAVVVGVLFAGILCMRLAAPIAFAAPVPQLALSLAVSAAFAAILLLQTGMLRLAGAVTLQQEFIAELNGVKRTSLALYSILLPPALLLCPDPRRQRRNVDLRHSGRDGNRPIFVPKRVFGTLCRQKSFDFPLDFVPLHRRIVSGQPALAADRKTIEITHHPKIG